MLALPCGAELTQFRVAVLVLTTCLNSKVVRLGWQHGCRLWLLLPAALQLQALQAHTVAHAHERLLFCMFWNGMQCCAVVLELGLQCSFPGLAPRPHFIEQSV